jgi:hypothetical protein
MSKWNEQEARQLERKYENTHGRAIAAEREAYARAEECPCCGEIIDEPGPVGEPRECPDCRTIWTF